MAWGNKGKSNGKKKSGARLTGLFKSKKKGLLVGKMRQEEIEGLVKVIKQARADEKEIVIFAYRNTDDDSDTRLYNLSCDVAQDMEKGGKKSYGKGGGKKSSIEDDEDAPEGDDDDNSGDEGHDDKDDDIDL